MSTIDASFSGKVGDFNLNAQFSIPSHGVTAIFGPSGCGKTSVLRCIAGLDQLTNGSLSVGGIVWQDQKIFLPPHKRPIGYVFQEASLFNHLSVSGNLTYGQRRYKAPNTHLSLDNVIDLLGLNKLLNRSPQNLSGGERQRVAIGRALLSAPEILLMDEPLAALDHASRNEILPYLERLHERMEIPILYVSHDMAEVERLADHMVFMEGGSVSTSGALIDLLNNPELPFSRAPEAAALIEGVVVKYDEKYGLTTLSIAGAEMIVPGTVGPLGSAHRLRVTASDVGLCQGPLPDQLSIQNIIEARVISVQPMGEFQATVFLELGQKEGGAKIIARITRKSFEALALTKGSPVTALIKSIALLD